jgi:eukaryotic-like serine/threonine-protein kinase
MEGTVIADRYRIENLAGNGGMATVWRATDLQSHRTVAIKRMHSRLIQNSDARGMFDDEIAITRSIQSQYVVGYTGHGCDVDGPWIALEWVEGMNAHELIATRKIPLGIRATLSLAHDLLSALAVTHGPGIGVIHRDVAPANVLIGVDGSTRLADYGLARSIARARLNWAGTAKGKIGYLPPEVLRGSLHGTRGDLYGIGAVLWELLAGRRLFAGVQNKSALAYAYLHSRRPLLQSANPEVPDEVADVINLALSLDPAKRPPTAMAMTERLFNAADREGVSAADTELSVSVYSALRTSIARRQRSEIVRGSSIARPDGSFGWFSESTSPMRG